MSIRSFVVLLHTNQGSVLIKLHIISTYFYVLRTVGVFAKLEVVNK